jgi:hypothetical protein
LGVQSVGSGGIGGRANASDFLEVSMVTAPAAAASLIAVLRVTPEPSGGLVRFSFFCLIFDIGFLSIGNIQRILIRCLRDFPLMWPLDGVNARSRRLTRWSLRVPIREAHCPWSYLLLRFVSG